jgi:hypothetical protein
MKDLVLEFLTRQYPMGRIKHGKRFKRGLNIDGVNYLYPKDKLKIQSLIYDKISNYYCLSSDEIYSILLLKFK